MRFRMLGPLEFWDGTGWADIKATKCRSLLAALLIDAGQPCSVDRLIAELWGDSAPATAVNQIHGYVSRLRRMLFDRDGRVLVTRAPGYLLRVAPEDVDTGRFAALVEQSTQALHAGEASAAAELLTEALSLWRGPALADVPVTPLVAEETARLHERRLAAVETRITADLACDRHDDVIAELRMLTSRHPLRELLWHHLVVALDRGGRQAEALSAYADARAVFVEELGVDPGSELRQAYLRIIAADRRPAARQVPNMVPTGLPTLVGRDALLASARHWLASTAPWVAITGPGGVGKTVFALCLAHSARDLFPDGVLVAPRAAVPVGEALLTRVLGAYGMPVPDDLPEDSAGRAELLWAALDGRRVLIVLDDVPDETHIRPLLPTAPGCGLMVTSRRRLTGLDMMRPLPLDVLPVEAGVTLLRTVAGEERAQHEAAPAVVTACGGLPLAIKIAGARLLARPNWTVADLARRLTDASNRLDWLEVGDRGVRASLAQSMASLTEDQRRLLRRLAILNLTEFAGWVAAALLELPDGPAERVLDDLVEAHLVEPAGHGLTGPRYTVHDLVRLVAGERATDSDVAALGPVWHGWLALAGTADDQLAHWFGLDPEPPPAWRPAQDVQNAVARNAMSWFDEEHDALVIAVRQAVAQGHAAVAWALAQRMSTYLELRGRYGTWHEVLILGLRGADARHDRQGQATMLGLLMQAEGIRDKHRDSLRYGALTLAAYREVTTPPMTPYTAVSTSSPALEKARSHGDALAIGFEASRLALALRSAGVAADYLALFEEARDAFRAGDVPLLELWTLKNIGLVYCRQHRFDEADQCMRRAQALVTAHGDLLLTGFAGGDLAGVAAAHDRTDLAEQLAGQALQDARTIGDPWSEGRALTTLADVRAAHGDHPGARAFYREALTLWRHLRAPHRVTQITEILARLEIH
jgi:DNA-binding SARP family transcriptional activator